MLGTKFSALLKFIAIDSKFALLAGSFDVLVMASTLAWVYAQENLVLSVSNAELVVPSGLRKCLPSVVDSTCYPPSR